MPTPPKPPPRLAHIPELDGIRGIAALMVLCHHLFYTSIPHPEQWNRFVVLASRLSSLGNSGVDLFFVLSGFLITSLLILDRDSPYFYWNFYWKRALRILPLYLFALVALAAFAPQTWRYVLLSLFFAANFAPAFHVLASGPFWTLAIEEQFYLVWPRFARALGTSNLEALAITVAVASPLLRLLAAAFGHHDYLFTFFHCDGLALGAMLACEQQRRASQSHNPTTSKASKILRPLYLLPIAILLTALPLVMGLHVNPESRPYFAGLALGLTGVSLLAYCVVAFAVHHTGSALLAIFRSRALTFFGLISYCLYIANSYTVTGYDRIFGPMDTGNMRQYAVRAAAVVTATVAICIISRYALELPAMSLRRYVLRNSSRRNIPQ